MEQGCETNDLSPRDQRCAVGKEIDGRLTVSFMRDGVEDAARQLHHSERMFETAMRGPWVDEISQCELMNVSKALKRPRVDRRHLVGGDTDKVMNRIADLVLVLGHVWMES